MVVPRDACSAAVVHAGRHRADHDMDSLMPLLLLVCACARSEPLKKDVQQRNDGYGVYAGGYTRGYEPVAYAALSLHPPIPVLHLLSRVPLRGVNHDQHTGHSMARPNYAHPYSYAGSMNQYVYDNIKDANEPTLLYARPNPRGGYTYRRRPVKPRVPARPTTSDPLIIRVHKYRVVRDR